jgi:23S rRNA (cytidine1920-2'-O)/16S rRNA (cytidine1409-2'-O)-methyltransferase
VRRRLDQELVRRGLSGSRTEAREAVEAGLVTVGGRPATKVGTLVAPDEALALARKVRRFASRGGGKLDAALSRFGIDPAGRDCLDAGASTGGFTDRLLRGDAARVFAVDVGYGQLAWALRNDTRVTVMDRTNVRRLTPEMLPFVPDLLVADLSFIPLRLVLPTLVSLTTPTADLVLLVKPQFEAGRGDVGRGGVVREPSVWRRVLKDVASTCRDLGAEPMAVMASPLVGPAGNVEFLLHARRGADPVDDPGIDAAVSEGEVVRG